MLERPFDERMPYLRGTQADPKFGPRNDVELWSARRRTRTSTSSGITPDALPTELAAQVPPAGLEPAPSPRLAGSLNL